MKTKRITYLSLGTNQGNKLENLQNAINLIADEIGNIQKVSSVYKTPSWGFDGNDFYNICVKISTFLLPEILLSSLLKIENKLGRTRSDKEVYQNRNIDIDILLINDKIIFSKALIVPHSKMLERKFVLIPLAEIASEVTHPIQKKTIANCLQNCNDSSEIALVEKKLKRPIPISEKYNYIAIEGNIGAGKTTLAEILSKEFNAKTVLERFSDNAFLPKFYNDKKRYAFPLEMSFLADRYQQLTDNLAQISPSENLVISDYYIFKSLIFAQITLQKEEYLLYKKMFNLVYKQTTKPDLYIYLSQNTERLLENIKKRGRSYEQNIENCYLKNIENGYNNFINREKILNLQTIDISNLDFVNNPQDCKTIINKIKNF
ncbi:2-amino-4-hydroxy-6-hydroxymethyldihydropteridine diphosphokinase [uncultured Polaribacter sp.]|uniref:2-amino-4-hydroxy-6- hydroxymethyldihydropteridine diphosphokinase n=1 Tax=uncultured Polaribacter sp. TaxID=174711 RepID=UPI0026357DA0|nr:2-amino-4-hydroxy-6-hydroxymethyldihydropteridine diphosphokinase [uncultured Polaribacter sp.]